MPKDIADYVNASGNVGGQCEGTVKKAYPPRSVTIRKTGALKTVQDIIIEDETGEIKFSVWEPQQKIEEGQHIYIDSVYSSFDDYKQTNVLNLGKKGTIQLGPGGSISQSQSVVKSNLPSLADFMVDIAAKTEHITTDILANLKNKQLEFEELGSTWNDEIALKYLSNHYKIPLPKPTPVPTPTTRLTPQSRTTPLFDMTSDELRTTYPTIKSGAVQGMIEKLLMHKQRSKNEEDSTKKKAPDKKKKAKDKDLKAIEAAEVE